MNRGERRNALDEQLLEALFVAVAEAGEQVIVLGSTSRAAFCSGLDRTISMSYRARMSDRLYQLYEQMIASRAVIIAALNGHVIGGGAQLALASDIRIAGPDTVIRFVGPGHGLAVGAWGLPSLVGRGRALELCLSMRRVGATEALNIGLVDRVSGRPEEAASALAGEIGSLDPEAVRRCKEIVRRAAAAQVDALALEREGNSRWGGNLVSTNTAAEPFG